MSDIVENMNATECSCGHHHDHNDKCDHSHQHDEHCYCGHEHHEHNSHYEDNKNNDFENDFSVNITTHDQSIIASYKFSVSSTSKKDVATVMDSFISKLGSDVEVNGGIIGHIKGIIYIANECNMFSVTYDTAVNYTPLDTKKAFIEGVAIVFNLGKSDLENIIKTNYLYIKEKRSQHE